MAPHHPARPPRWRAVTPVLRPVALPPAVPGRLWLTAMPGRHAPFDAFATAAQAAGLTRLVCLAQPAEVAAVPAYAAARRGATLGLTLDDHPMPDFGVPDDPAAFAALAARVAAALLAGEAVAIHCAAGVGRTGLLAIAVLAALGLPLAEAEARVRAAGSGPESAAQRRFLGLPDTPAP